MALDHDLLAAWTFQDVVHRYDARDTILYALGVGCGAETDDLPFVYENGLMAIPSMATIIGDPGFWLQDPRLGADWQKAVHGEQAVELHAPLPAETTMTVRNTVDRIVDKGPGRGVFVYTSRTLFDQEKAQPVATLTSTIVLRGDGRHADEAPPAAKPMPAPTRKPELTCRTPTLPQGAAIYRLSGDLNPLHIDPETAAVAGFPKPILHGLCTFGIATRTIVRACCDNRPERLRRIGGRFSAPIYPGETVRTEIWIDDETIHFACVAEEREALILSAGTASVRD